jgi:uncharacterized protein with FMN-binding domain
MISGIVSAVLFLLVSFKYVSGKLGLKKLDYFFTKTHCLFGISLLILSAFHMYIALKLRYQRPVLITLTGIFMFILILIAIFSYIFSKKINKKWLFFHRITATLILILLIVHIFFGIVSFSSYQRSIASITTFQNIDVNKIKDGKYEGEYDAGYIYAKVRVTVSKGKITAIDILQHQNERGQSAEKITDKIISAQSLNVDAVSGATNSSKVIKKAVESALLKGLN